MDQDDIFVVPMAHHRRRMAMVHADSVEVVSAARHRAMASARANVVLTAGVHTALQAIATMTAMMTTITTKVTKKVKTKPRIRRRSLPDRGRAL